MLSKRALGLLMVVQVSATALGAQAWDDPRVLSLVQRATERRVQQLADSGLAGYQATAHGYLTFLAQLGQGFRELPRVVKADELAIEVYWRAPNLSKQRIVGRRDTTLLPTDIEYHRDHLGIIQNNFPAIIRVGEGDEVSDVPHPLSESGLAQYQFALTDSLRITIPGRVIDVYEVQVRPRNDRLPGVVGAVYLDKDDARVVRMAFSFTKASLLDKQLEDVSIVLENGLVDSRFWLPRRQEVEIRRTLTWLDYPVRGIIRGRWDIGSYSINTELPVAPFFTGPEITQAPLAQLRAYQWPTPNLVDSLPPESRIPTPMEIRRVQDAARLLIREQGLRSARVAAAGRSASDFLRFDRNSGLSLGAGLTGRVAGGWSVQTRGRYGFGDRRGRGEVSLGRESGAGIGLRAFVFDDERDAGDTPERSGMVNSLAAQEFASDFTDRFSVRGGGAEFTYPDGPNRWSLRVASESQAPLSVKGVSFSRSFSPAFPANRADVIEAAVGLERSTTSFLGADWAGAAQLRWRAVKASAQLCDFGGIATTCDGDGTSLRGSFRIDGERALGAMRLTTRTMASAVSARTFLLPQDLVFLGGPVSAPGFQFHELSGDRAVAQTFEIGVPIPVPSIGLGRFGRSAPRALLSPHWTVVGLERVRSTPIRTPVILPGNLLRPRGTGWYQSAGVAFTPFFDLVRFDVSRELPSGKWFFSVDVARPFWAIL